MPLLAENRYITLKYVKLKYNIFFFFTENLHNLFKNTKTKKHQKQRKKKEMEE